MTEPLQKKSLGLSLEFMIQVAGILVAITMAYMAIDFRSKATDNQLGEVKADVSALHGRVREVETQQVRLDERFVNIMNLLTRINDRLENQESSK